MTTQAIHASPPYPPATCTVGMERTGTDLVLDDPAREFAFAGGAPAPARLEARLQPR